MKHHWRVARTLLTVLSLSLLTVAPAQASGAADGSKLEGTVVSVVQVTDELGGSTYAVTIADEESGALFTFAMPADYPLTMRFWNLDWQTAAGSLTPGTEVKVDLDETGHPVGLKNEHDEELEVEGELVSYTPPADGQPGSITLLVDGVEVTHAVHHSVVGLDGLAPGAEVELKGVAGLLLTARTDEDVETETDAEGESARVKWKGTLVSYSPAAETVPGTITMLVNGVELTVTLSGEAEEWVDPEAGLAYELEIEEGRIKLKVEEREPEDADVEDSDAPEADEPDEHEADEPDEHEADEPDEHDDEEDEDEDHDDEEDDDEEDEDDKDEDKEDEADD